MPLRRHVDYVYLAILESQDEYSEPARLVDDDLDINTRPHFDQVKALLGVQSLGRLFKDSLGQLGSGFVLVPSAEMLASWPDG
ncbi:hypothetical protein BCR35DRAFT_307289 [Leucosporidium creatinivorum]|uniref:Uncharacterized protein n=1 Tax=Leucosporidium creatinivorum TaxID=106004 RepID=A0A1Y2EP14_9BASI|nr:hypothetical protein BCR35DRAFT_307289 [Leucosporidium creatinivorum]